MPHDHRFDAILPYMVYTHLARHFMIAVRDYGKDWPNLRVFLDQMSRSESG